MFQAYSCAVVMLFPCANSEQYSPFFATTMSSQLGLIPLCVGIALLLDVGVGVDVAMFVDTPMQ